MNIHSCIPDGASVGGENDVRFGDLVEFSEDLSLEGHVFSGGLNHKINVRKLYTNTG